MSKKNKKNHAGMIFAICILSVVFVVMIGYGLYVFGGNAVPDHFPEYPKYNALDYVELGDYYSIQVSQKKVIDTPTDDEVQLYMQNSMPLISASKTAVVQDGSFVNIDFVGTVNGEVVRYGSASDYVIRVGSDTLISDFEKALVGMKVGDVKVLNISYPSNYKNKQLAGKTAEFKVKLNDVLKPDVLSDANVAAVTDGAVATVDAYFEYAKNQLYMENVMTANQTVKTELFSHLKKICTVKAIPAELMDWYVESSVIKYKHQAAAADMTLKEYLVSNTDLTRQAGYPIESEEDLRAYYQVIGKESLQIDIIMDAIAAAESDEIVIQEQWIDQYIENMAAQNGYKDVEEFKRVYSESFLWHQMLVNSVGNYLLQYSWG